MITQNQEAFLQLLAGDGGEGEFDEEGGEGGLPPGVIEVTEEEKAAIDRLTALGFDRQMVIEAFLVCNKDEALAANYLLEMQMGDLGGGQEGGHQHHGGGGGGHQGDDYEDDNLFH